VSDGDGGLVVVCDAPDLQSMAAYLLCEERHEPAVALTQSLSMDAPVLSHAHVRAIVGASPRIYLIQRDHLLRPLQRMLGRRLALAAGGARIWWPGLSVGSDPGAHPLVLYLAGEPERDMLDEFTRQFHLSHPVVRREIKLLDELRALAERELAQAREQNRSMKVERHEALARAEAAEHALKVATGQSRSSAVGDHDEPETNEP
jgi:hypothetical protein